MSSTYREAVSLFWSLMRSGTREIDRGKWVAAQEFFERAEVIMKLVNAI